MNCASLKIAFFRTALLFTVALLFSSCATLLTKKTYDLKVKSDGTGDRVEIEGETFTLPATVPVRRSKEDLHVKLFNDSVSRDYIIRASPNSAFVYGNLVWFQVCPLAYLTDLTTQKRFYYGRSIDFHHSDTASVIVPRVGRRLNNYFGKEYAGNRGQINLVFSVPHVNSFYLQPQGEPAKNNTGFMGVAAGLEYFYHPRRSVSVSVNAVADFFVPVPAPVDFDGRVETMSSVYFSLQQNHIHHRFHFGYGLSYGRNTWAVHYYGYLADSANLGYRKSTKAVGLIANAHFQFSRTMLAGVVYRPTLLRVAPKTDFKYEHLISIEFVCKLRVKK